MCVRKKMVESVKKKKNRAEEQNTKTSPSHLYQSGFSTKKQNKTKQKTKQKKHNQQDVGGGVRY